jgi:pentatricopeptide repeat protein
VVLQQCGSEGEYLWYVRQFGVLGDLEAAAELVRQFVASPPPSARPCAAAWLYDELLRTHCRLCSRRGDGLDGVLAVWQETISAGFAPALRTSTTVLHQCAQARRWRDAEDVLRSMRCAGLTPNVYSFSSVINACAQAGQVDAAVQWLQAMRKEGLKPDVNSMNVN